jgi:hypothetical protein
MGRDQTEGAAFLSLETTVLPQLWHPSVPVRQNEINGTQRETTKFVKDKGE